MNFPERQPHQRRQAAVEQRPAHAADALRKTAAATEYRASKNIVSSQTHTHAHP
jgi:hypothetical protein